MAKQNSKLNSTVRQLTHKKPRTIDGISIPSTLESGLAQGFEMTGHGADSKSVRGNVETLKGTATFKQDGLPWLECPVTVTMAYDWSRLRAHQRTSLLKV